MFGRAKNLDKTVATYAGVAIHLSAKTADDLKKEFGYSEEKSTVIMLQILTFCIINLMRTFAKQGVSVDKGRAAIESILLEAAKMLSPDKGSVQETHRALIETTGEWIKTYGKLPLGEKLSTQTGTLIWEYGKLIVSTVGKNSNDIQSILLASSRVVNVNNALDTTMLIKALK